MLKLQLKNKPQKSIWLVGESLTVGKGRRNHFIIDDPDIEDVHAELRIEDDKVYIVDKVGGKTSVNNQAVFKQQLINLGDVIRLNTVELEVVDPKRNAAAIKQDKDYKVEPTQSMDSAVELQSEQAVDTDWNLVAVGSELDGKRFPIGKLTTIGRDNSCDIVIPGQHLSRLHAQLSVEGSSVKIVDMGSVNGTYIDDKKISTLTVLPNTHIRFDSFTFRLEGPEPEHEQTLLRPALDFPRVDVTESQLIDDDDIIWPDDEIEQSIAAADAAAKKSSTDLQTAIAVVLGLLTATIIALLVIEFF